MTSPAATASATDSGSAATASATIPDPRTDGRATDPFARRFGKPLPRPLRAEATPLSWPDFEAAYTRRAGRYRLEGLSTRPCGNARTEYTAALNIDGDTRLARTRAHGPASAMTAILHDAGMSIEIASLHQHRVDGRTATFLLCSRGMRRRWAMGFAPDSAGSIVDALVSAANLLTD